MKYLEMIAKSLGKTLRKRGSKYIINSGGYSTGVECESLEQVANELSIKVKYLNDMYYQVK
tara:strand:- start:305 stop:487 length:183 start_codon:yes stop_codon:yes gene_type:complete